MKKLFFSSVSWLSGFLNGLFGTGGGVVLWFAASKQGDERKALATSSAGVLLLSLFSAMLYGKSTILFDKIPPTFVLFSVIGGAIGAALLGRVPTTALRFLFSVLLVLSGAYALGKGIQNVFFS